MQPRTKIGLIVGVIGLVLNTCVFGFLGFLSLCGTIISLIAGGIAGSFTVQQEKPATKKEGARAGATAGGIAGGLIILGQVLGGLGAWLYLQASGTPIDVQVPNLPGDPGAQLGLYTGTIGTVLCFGFVSVLLAAGAGAGLGYLVTSEQPMTPPPQDIMN
jgi:hypothetical protein